MSTDKNSFPPTGKETSSFAKTCYRLSSFLKERGSLKNIRINDKLDVKGKPEISSLVTEKNLETVDLLSNIETTVHTSINHLPEYVSLDSYCKPEDSTNKAGSSEPDVSTEYCETGPMTIFYGGQIIVLDYVSADKARDLILAARSASSSSTTSDNQVNQTQNKVKPVSTSISPFESQDNGSDLPIARRASLHRFLAKRKDRATVRAPYQLHNPLVAAEPLNHKFDLNL